MNMAYILILNCVQFAMALKTLVFHALCHLSDQSSTKWTTSNDLILSSPALLLASCMCVPMCLSPSVSFPFVTVGYDRSS